MMRVASDETNSRSCETKTRVPEYLSSAVLSDSIDSMSRWLVGSSSSITFGMASTSLPMTMRCRLLLVVAREQQLAERGAHDLVVVAALRAAPAAQPVGEQLVGLEFLRRVLRPVGGACLVRPFHNAGFGRQQATQ